MPQSSPFSLLEQPRRRLPCAGRPRAARPAAAAPARVALGRETRRPPTMPPRRRPSGTQHRT
ncbi:hypothetical protein BFR06_03690 [Burkholderia pseudomallei]|nr:hypothetical protein BFR05_03680 [Burkholderia pseudomallei]APF97068.1 hypothetical protein BFR06_03690 [Burkholderia pseudomallei]KEO67713.1 hypothetical protein J103_20760 [Burkholderia pseudomallei MSHR5855]